MFKTLKEINIYYNVIFIYHKKEDEKKKYSLHFLINKYIKTMTKLNIFEIINVSFSFPFNNKEIDFEMIGIILAILLIYAEIKIKYKFPLILYDF